MKREVAKFISTLAVVFLCFSGCTASREREVEGDINEFRSWVTAQANQVAERTEEDWARTKEDFRIRTQELDQKQERFSEEVKADYQRLKDEFRNLDEERTTARARRARVEPWERILLGQYADLSTINRENVRDAYVTLLENVRSRRSTWNNEDWEMAKLVLQELNDKKDEVDEDLPTEDEVKIKALQMEFTTLETADDLGGN